MTRDLGRMGQQLSSGPQAGFNRWPDWTVGT